MNTAVYYNTELIVNVKKFYRTGSTKLSIMTLFMMTFSITTLNIKGLFTILSINDTT